MTWILFIIVASYQGPAATTAEFSNHDACEKAAKNISAIFNKNIAASMLFAFKKELEKQNETYRPVSSRIA